MATDTATPRAMPRMVMAVRTGRSTMWERAMIGSAFNIPESPSPQYWRVFTDKEPRVRVNTYSPQRNTNGMPRATQNTSRGGPATRKKDPPALTPRQKQILRLVAEGLTNREIAHHFGISVRTVEVHRFNLMRRLRVRNVAQLLRQSLILRLLPKSFFS
ncbi:MAG: hypothetical protein EXR96_01805 [Nitrospiraceae bacterium]|nr:hypothetical protein [Nitrospiraceae bacterium]